MGEENGKLVIDGYPLPNVQRFHESYDEAALSWTDGHSYLFRLLARRLSKLEGLSRIAGQKGPADFDEDQSDLFLHPEKTSTKQVLSINRELLKGLVESFQDRQIPVIVLAIPTKCDITDCFGVRQKTDAARKALEHIVSDLQITYIDPTLAFEIGDFWTKDLHWRPSGHRKAAAALLPAAERALGRKQ
jgi:hypothetical protein